MIVLHLNKSDTQGEAAQAAYRLHKGLRRVGVESKMFVDNEISDNSDVYGPKEKISKLWSKITPFMDRLPLEFYDWQGTPFYPTWIGKNIVRDELVKQADIINLHWIAGRIDVIHYQNIVAIRSGVNFKV